MPVSTSLSTSPSTCSRGGHPPFTVQIEHKCITAQPIWALIFLDSDRCNGIEVRNPNDLDRPNRRIGPPGTSIADNEDAVDLHGDDTTLIRLEPGLSFTRTYTFSVVPKVRGLRSSDIRNLETGKHYDLTLRQHQWRWMIEDDALRSGTMEGRKRILESLDATIWRSECSVRFQVVE